MAQHRTEEAEKQFRAAKALYLRLDGKIGQINCFLGLSDLYRENGRAEESLREALGGVVLAFSIDLPNPQAVLTRLLALRQKIGKKLFATISQRVIASFPVTNQNTLVLALRMAFDETADPNSGTPGKPRVQAAPPPKDSTPPPS